MASIAKRKFDVVIVGAGGSGMRASLQLSLAGLNVVQLPLPGVVHDAQRASHRDAKYLRWHLGSMLRFFSSGVFLRLQWQRLIGRGRGRP